MKFTGQKPALCNFIHNKSHTNCPDIEPTDFGDRPRITLLGHGMVMV